MRALGPWLYEGLVGPLHGGRHLTDTSATKKASGRHPQVQHLLHRDGTCSERNYTHHNNRATMFYIMQMI